MLGCAARRADLRAWPGELGRLGAQGPPGEPVGLRAARSPGFGALLPGRGPPYAPGMSECEPLRWRMFARREGGFGPADGEGRSERGAGRRLEADGVGTGGGRRERPRGAFAGKHTVRLALCTGTCALGARARPPARPRGEGVSVTDRLRFAGLTFQGRQRAQRQTGQGCRRAGSRGFRGGLVRRRFPGGAGGGGAPWEGRFEPGAQSSGRGAGPAADCAARAADSRQAARALGGPWDLGCC